MSFSRTYNLAKWGLFVIFLASIPTIIFVPKWLVNQALKGRGSEGQLKSIPPEKYADLVDSYRKTVIQAVAGSALFGTLWLTLLTIRSNQLGKVADRFAKALDHLGAVRSPADQSASEVRIGAIAELELIGDESGVERRLIKRSLAAYVRHYAWWQSTVLNNNQPAVWRLKEIQVMLAVMGKWGFDKDEAGDLRLTDLDLRHLRLSEKARFDHVLADRSHFEYAEMRGASFRGASLNRASFCGANLQHADFRNAVLTNVEFRGQAADPNRWGWHQQQRKYDWDAPSKDADVTGADFSGADLTDASISQKQIALAKKDDNTKLPGTSQST